MVVRRSFWFFLAIVASAFFATWYTGIYSAFPGSRLVFLRMGFLGLFLISLNFFWTWLAIKRLSVKRTQRFLRLQVGYVFEERFEVENPIRLWRLWIEIEDESQLPGKAGSKVLSRIGPKQDRFYISRALLIQRGSFELGPTVIRSGDPFGMFVTEKVFPSEKKLIVLPYMVDIKRMKEPPGFLPGGRSVRQKSLEATSYASGVRDYQPGDPLNRIHWKSSAKRDRFMVKEFDQDPKADIWILVDAHLPANYAQEINPTEYKTDAFWTWRQKDDFKLSPSTFEYVVSIAASLVNYYIKAEKAVGLASAAQTMTLIPTEKGERQLGKLLETLAYINPTGTLSINGLIEAVSMQINRGSTVIVITSTPRENFQIGLEVLMRKRLNPIIILIDRESFRASAQSRILPTALDMHNVPYVVIRQGDSLVESLESFILHGGRI